ncbi:MAG: hypothetical protein U0Q10_10625 [Dermatophilaceae bacterium]
MRATSLAVGSLAAGCLATLTAPAQAAYPGTNGRIAVETNSAMFTIAAKGGSMVSLGPGTGPRWSPDGAKLAFAYRGAIWTMNANGTGRIKITSGTGHDVNPTWSPDGKRIAFSRSVTGSKTGRSLAVVTVATKAVAALTTKNDGCAFDPTWAKTGRYVVYIDQCPTGSDSTDTIRKVDTTTGAVSTIVPVTGVAAFGGKWAHYGGRADVLASGTKILWYGYDTDTYETSLVTSDLAGGSVTYVSGTDAEFASGDPAASPDGKLAVSGYGYDVSSVESFCLSSGCTGTFDWDIPSGAWATSVDWQPLH